MTADNDRKEARHKAAMEKQKAKVDAAIEAADPERGVAVITNSCEDFSRPSNVTFLLNKEQ